VTLLAGRTIVVAGVGPGLGRALVLRCAEHGADVVLVARRRDQIDALAGELRALGQRALAVQADLADPDACWRIAEQATAELGPVDGLVLNAFSRPALGPLTRGTAADWTATVQTNLVGPLALVAALEPTMAAAERASIVTVSSISARDPYVNSGIYAATKAALHSITRSLAIELGPLGITANALVPGFIEAPTLDAFFAAEAERLGTTPAAARAQAAATTALGRFASTREVADAAIFLLSELSAGVTGQTLDVNAGQRFE
jgi:NAD(P)-dependent dehydrogenase (short-subunit alcohol dehydrogenase family)